MPSSVRTSLATTVLGSGENVQISSSHYAGNNPSPRDQNVAKITLDREVQLSTTDNQIKLTSNSDRVLLVTPTGSLLVTNFSSLSLTILGPNHSNPSNNTNHPKPSNGTNSTQPDDELDEREPETPTNLKAHKDELLLANSTRFKDWLNSTNLFHGTVITLFNITNYQDVLNGSIPVLQEEEFRFEQKRTIQVVGWEEDERFVQVKQIKHYFYVSPRDLETNITTINYPLIVLYDFFKHLKLNRSLRFLLKGYIKSLDKLPLYVNVTVGDLLFRGYQDQTTTFVRRFNLIFKKLGITFPKSVNTADGRFSLLGRKNGSDSGLWSVNTGLYNLADVGQITRLNGSDKNSAWDGKCRQIEGTDGVIHSRLADDSIKIFVPEMDRPVELEEMPFNRTIDGGAKVRKFVWSNKTFASPRTWTPNECYFPGNPRSIDGVMKKSKGTADGEPIVFSNPHFLAGDRLLANYFRLKPNRTKHESFVQFKNATGELVNETRNIQINLETTSAGHRVNGFVWPVFWYSDVSFISNEGFDSF